MPSVAIACTDNKHASCPSRGPQSWTSLCQDPSHTLPQERRVQGWAPTLPDQAPRPWGCGIPCPEGLTPAARRFPRACRYKHRSGRWQKAPVGPRKGGGGHGLDMKHRKNGTGGRLGDLYYTPAPGPQVKGSLPPACVKVLRAKASKGHAPQLKRGQHHIENASAGSYLGSECQA